jgi:hypothetical protein
MRQAAVRIGVVAWLICSYAAPAPAQNPAPPIPTVPCDSCQKLERDLHVADEALSQIWSERILQSEFLRLVNRDSEPLIKARDALREKVTAAGAFATDQAKAQLADLDAEVSARVPRRDELTKTVADLNAEEDRLHAETNTLYGALDNCHKSCTPAGRRTTPAGPCTACDWIPGRINHLESELSDLRERIDGLERTQKDVETLKAGAKGNQVQALDGQLKLMQQRHQESAKQQEQKLKELGELKGRLKDCKKSCETTQPTSQFFQGPLPWALGGGVALSAILFGGDGDTPTQIASTPVTPQQPPVTTVNPAPVPAPAPDAIDQRMGVYLFQSCVCEFDPGGNDPFIRLCQSAQQFRLIRTGANTARLEGSAPLFTSDFILDANSQTIDANAVGLVGASSASLHYSGTFGSAGSPNLLLSLGYVISNSTTRYRVTAVKQ